MILRRNTATNPIWHMEEREPGLSLLRRDSFIAIRMSSGCQVAAFQELSLRDLSRRTSKPKRVLTGVLTSRGPCPFHPRQAGSRLIVIWRGFSNSLGSSSEAGEPVVDLCDSITFWP